MLSINQFGPHFFHPPLVYNGKTADILSEGAGRQSSTAAVERFRSLVIAPWSRRINAANGGIGALAS